MTNDKKCIFCGIRDGTTADHVPPRAFFPRPLPEGMITVPACGPCHAASAKEDGTVRNLLVSTQEAEQHPSVLADLAGRRDRSLARSAERSGADIVDLVRLMKEVEVVSQRGIYTGKAAALNFDNPIMDRFVERVARALLWHEYRQPHFDGIFQWRMNVDLPPAVYEGVMRFGKMRRIGDVFAYGLTPLSDDTPCWSFVSFFGCTELMIRTEKDAEQDVTPNA